MLHASKYVLQEMCFNLRISIFLNNGCGIISYHIYRQTDSNTTQETVV
jgi:hypothetical protein